MTTEDETYNGWSNRETWAMNLWLENDEGIYQALNARLRQAADDYMPEYDFQPIGFPDYLAGDLLQEFWEDFTDPTNYGAAHYVEHILPMVRDVGSIWRVDWTELGAGWLTNLPVEETQ